jgi:hypothetical protein
MTVESLWVALARIHNGHPSLYSISKHIPHMPLPIRKGLLVLTQIQFLPPLYSRAYGRLSSSIDLSFLGHNHETTTVRKLLLGSEYLISSPVFSGYISMLCRNLPFLDIDEVMESLDVGIEKELGAAREIYHPKTMDWSAMMSFDKNYRHSHSIDPGFTIQGEINDHVFYGLQNAGARIADTLLYPDYSTKTIGEIATRNLRELIPNTSEILSKGDIQWVG